MERINKNIARNIKNYLDILGKEPADLARDLGCAPSTVYTWLQGNSTPRMEKIDRMCFLFGCEREDLISETLATPEDAQKKQLALTFNQKFRDLDPDYQLRIISQIEHFLKLQQENRPE